MHSLFLRSAAVFGILAAMATTGGAADPPSAKLALSFKPKQVDVEYDIPQESEYAKCKVTVVRKGKASGWVVLGPGGETLRRFMDTDGDNIVDHWGYYLRGLEVYRDIDSDADNKIDQFRWMNTAGSRWGIDDNADGYVDRWKMISAQEASRSRKSCWKKSPTGQRNSRRTSPPMGLTAKPAGCSSSTRSPD